MNLLTNLISLNAQEGGEEEEVAGGEESHNRDKWHAENGVHIRDFAANIAPDWKIRSNKLKCKENSQKRHPENMRTQERSKTSK